MTKIRGFIDKNLGYLLVVPALFFIVAFSLLPILQSIRYAFFDFQLNDQQKAGLYFSQHYNIDLSQETFEYIEFFLEDEIDLTSDENTKSEIESYKNKFISENEKIIEEFNYQQGIIKISDKEAERLYGFSNGIQNGIEEIYSKYPELMHKEDVKEVTSELSTAIIEPNFIGLENFKKIMNDDRVKSSIVITLIFTFASVAMELVLGLALALIMNKGIKGRGMVRTMSLIPWAIPTAVAALMWSYLYSGSNGIVAHLLEVLHIIPDSASLLLTGSSALGAVIFADVWKTTPYMALLLLAGLQVIPTNLYEASSLDGANKWDDFIHITLPLLKPSILVALLFRTLDSFRVFDLIYVLTGGGPGGQTESISIYAYKTMFAQTRFGYGSATVILMAIVVSIIAFFYIKFLDVKLID